MNNKYKILGANVEVDFRDCSKDFFFSLDITLSGISIKLCETSFVNLELIQLIDLTLGNYSDSDTVYPMFRFDKVSKNLVCFFSSGECDIFIYGNDLCSSIKSISDLIFHDAKATNTRWSKCLMDLDKNSLLYLDMTIKSTLELFKFKNGLGFLITSNEIVGYHINLKEFFGSLWNDYELNFLSEYLSALYETDWDSEEVNYFRLQTILQNYDGNIFNSCISIILQDLAFFE